MKGGGADIRLIPDIDIRQDNTGQVKPAHSRLAPAADYRQNGPHCLLGPLLTNVIVNAKLKSGSYVRGPFSPMQWRIAVMSMYV